MSQWPNGEPWQTGSARAATREGAVELWHATYPASHGWRIGGVFRVANADEWQAFGGRVPPPYGGPYPLTSAR